ncbi:DUF2309 domain-containing protein [Vibrio sp. JPW-9-11-11]|uniref:YbcC family protein n=1 Tax=Vibrio sp. JPW-9-11-11 TaxID=1416532 RepID=UPI0015944C78|nr:DUF2309 domain-containing protein [Vibrio sp. JPW-9-11-11]NVD06341.1 DUF2309 domain-containing protein [Vibrio sp. JPW-9-11-11]
MNVETSTTIDLSGVVKQVCQRITPNWPLDQMIAVSPYWHRINQPFAQVAAALEKQAGSPMSMNGEFYLARWQRGEITEQDLQQANQEYGAYFSQKELVDCLSATETALTSAPLHCDALDSQRDLSHQPAWCDTITTQISQFCAAYFDQGLSDWNADNRQGLYASWRSAMERDYSVALLMKSKHINRRAKLLPDESFAAIEWALGKLSLSERDYERYLEACLLRMNGWASWCAYLNWQANFDKQSTGYLQDLLAIRLCWEWLILDPKCPLNVIWQRQWQHHYARGNRTQKLQVWQRADEIGYQTQLFDALQQRQTTQAGQPQVEAQVAFCIDVRSEVIRRHLEASSDHIATLGFAGFFGMPVSYNPTGTDVHRPQLPGLLAPQFSVSECCDTKEQQTELVKRRRAQLRKQQAWQPFHRQPSAAFTLVESTGLGYLSQLVKRALPLRFEPSGPKSEVSRATSCSTPKLSAEVTLEQRTQLAKDILTGMGMAQQQSRLVALIGHGAQTENNPQRAGLDCGACCGQSGEVNARAAAALLNDPQVRQQLTKIGVEVSSETWFVAGLHNTTTENVELLDVAAVPASHQSDIKNLRNKLNQASVGARRERATGMGIQVNYSTDNQLAQAFAKRAQDWSQTRPEWGLANNAAFIIAPRWRSRGVNLQGRVFMHEYSPSQDVTGEVLEKIMTAPMLVTHWINMQYFASTVDNYRYGSGNKTLHNVVGGGIGLFEGNGGDLRSGLAIQSVHDGQKWRHQPLRLTVVIDAPRASIQAVIDAHPVVKNLVDNRWLYLSRFGHDGIEQYQNGEWVS